LVLPPPPEGVTLAPTTQAFMLPRHKKLLDANPAALQQLLQSSG
jgi:hypothetical protein